MATLNECGVSAKQSAACTEKCKTCQREGIPILPLRYAVIPKEKSKGRALLGAGVQGGSSTYAAADLGKNYKKNVLKEHAYSLRTLRIGYVYVFLEATKAWEAYGVKPDGLLTQLKDPFKPAADALSAMKTVCYEADDNVPAAFINIKSIKDTPIIWLAFSQFAWEQGVFSKYAADAKLRARRMTKLNLSELKTNPNQGDAFEIDEGLNTLANWVEEYAHPSVGTERYSWRVPNLDKVVTNTLIDANAKTTLDKAIWSAHPFPTRAIPLGKVAATVKAKKSQYKMPVIAVALDDVPGMLQELNFSKTRATIENNIWSLIDDRAHKVLSANATHGLEAYIKKQAKAKVWIQNSFNDGKNLKVNDKGDLEFANQVLTFAEYEDHVAKGHLPTTTHWEKKVGTVIPGRGQMGRVVDDSQKKADKANSKQYEQFYNKLDKDKLKAFDDLYIPQLKKFTNQFEARDADMEVWLSHDSDPKKPVSPLGLTGLCQYDCVAAKRFDNNYVALVGSIFNGFQADRHTLAWIEKTLEHPIDAPEQILVRALVGNHVECIDALRGGDFNPKFYDIGKQIITASILPYKDSRNTLEGLVAAMIHVGGKLPGLTAATWKRIDYGMYFAGAFLEGVLHQPVDIKDMPAADVEEVVKTQTRKNTTPGKSAENSKNESGKSVSKRKLPSKIPKKIKLSFKLWVAEDAKMAKASATATSLETAAAATVAGGKGFKGISFSIKGRNFTLDGSSAKAWYAASLKNSTHLANTRDTGLVSVSLYFQWAGLRSAVKSYKDATLDQRDAAQLGLASASFAMIGGSFEAAKILSNIIKDTRPVESEVAISRWSKAAKWGNLLSGSAGIIAGCIDTFGGGKQYLANRQEGDDDAAFYYGAGTLTSMGGVIASAVILGGGTALFGSAWTLFLGPVGWAIALGLLTAYFFRQAGECEDTAPALWVAQNPYWGNGKSKFKNWKEEEDALYSIYYGVFVTMGFDGDNVSFMSPGTMPSALPTRVTFEMTIGRFDSAGQGWRYRLIGVHKDGKMVLLDQLYHHQATGFGSSYPPANLEELQLRREQGDYTTANGGLQLSRFFSISFYNTLDEIKLELDILTDLDDQDSYVPIRLAAKNNTTAKNY